MRSDERIRHVQTCDAGSADGVCFHLRQHLLQVGLHPFAVLTLGLPEVGDLLGGPVLRILGLRADAFGLEASLAQEPVGLACASLVTRSASACAAEVTDSASASASAISSSALFAASSSRRAMPSEATSGLSS